MNFREETKEIFKNTSVHFLTGNSYMLPILIIGGVASQLSLLFNASDSALLNVISQVGIIGMKYFIPIMAAYVAYSIADTPGIAPGLICGVYAQQNDLGYLGAFAGAFLAGYFTYILLNMEIPELFRSAWGMLLPVISTLVTAFLLTFVIGPPIEWITKNGANLILSLGAKGGGFMGIILGTLGGLDYGGSFSKIQSTFATAVIDQKIFTALGICGAAVTVPPLGMCLATILAPKLYTDTEIDYAKKSWLTALVAGFTEIVIPFAQNDAKNVTIATILGCSVTGMIAGTFSLKLFVPLLGLPQWFFYDKPLIYVLSLSAGVVTVAIVANLLKSINKKKRRGFR